MLERKHTICLNLCYLRDALAPRIQTKILKESSLVDRFSTASSELLTVRFSVFFSPRKNFSCLRVPGIRSVLQISRFEFWLGAQKTVLASHLHTFKLPISNTYERRLLITDVWLFVRMVKERERERLFGKQCLLL